MALAACASAPPHYASQTAQRYVGKPLFALEMHWSAPSELRQRPFGQVATWQFDQYNYAGCRVTVRTDRADVIRRVSWTQGCGPPIAKRPLHPEGPGN